MKMEYTEMIDLSHALVHNQESRLFQIQPVLVDFTPRLAAPDQPPKVDLRTIEEVESNAIPDGYFVLLHELSFNTNAGTHIEAPRHCIKHGPDLSEIPLDRLVGEAVILDLRECLPRSEVSVELIRKAAGTSGGIREGDIVFCMFGYDRFYKTEAYRSCPCFSPESINWLVQQRIKVLGIDGPEIDSPRATHPVNHLPLFQAGILLIENLTNLTQVKKPRVHVFILPLKIKYLDAFPVRVVALK